MLVVVFKNKQACNIKNNNYYLYKSNNIKQREIKMSVKYCHYAIKVGRG